MGVYSTYHSCSCGSEGEAQSLEFDDAELLTELIYERAGADASILSRALIGRYGSLPSVLCQFRQFDCANVEVPLKVGILLRTLSQTICRMHRREALSGIVLADSKSILDWLHIEMAHLRRESFRVLFLDSTNRLLADEELWEGTVTEVQIYPREVIRLALDHNATSLILVHNHPSGDSAPSRNDIFMTNRMIDACLPFELTVHDHLIIAKRGVFSMRAHQLLKQVPKEFSISFQ